MTFEHTVFCDKGMKIVIYYDSYRQDRPSYHMQNIKGMR